MQRYATKQDVRGLAERVDALGVTLTEAAPRLGYSLSGLHCILTGKRRIPIRRLAAIRAALGRLERSVALRNGRKPTVALNAAGNSLHRSPEAKLRGEEE